MEPSRTALDTRKLLSFVMFASAGLSVEWAMTRTAPFERGSLVPLAVLFDLVVVFPLVFATVVLRPARRSWLGAAPVMALGAMVAGALLARRADMKLPLRLAGAVAELAVLALLVVRVRKANGQLRGAASDDLLLRVGALSDPVLRVAGAEFLVVYYALVGPFVRRLSRPNEFGYTEESGLGGVLFAFGFVTLMETIAAHVLLSMWSARAAWVLTALSVYTLLWLAAAFQAARLRPVVVSEDQLLVRSSLLWTVEVPRDAIECVRAVDDAPRDKRVLRAALGTSPVLLVTLKRPVRARGPFGTHRTVDAIALYVDEPARLRAALKGG
jgi:hypothetical protein